MAMATEERHASIEARNKLKRRAKVLTNALLQIAFDSTPDEEEQRVRELVNVWVTNAGNLPATCLALAMLNAKDSVGA